MLLDRKVFADCEDSSSTYQPTRLRSRLSYADRYRAATVTERLAGSPCSVWLQLCCHVEQGADRGGGQPATVLYAGMTVAGVYQINVIAQPGGVSSEPGVFIRTR